MKAMGIYQDHLTDITMGCLNIFASNRQVMHKMIKHDEVLEQSDRNSML